MKKNTAILGAAFLMATSAIGPAFLNNTAKFTAQLTTSFGFIILVSILLDIGAQLNIWRIITVGEKRAQDLANDVFPGLGYLLAAMVAFGGLAFNIGNIRGCGLGIEVMTGLDDRWGALISCGIALFIFWVKEAGRAIDWFVRILGLAMIGLTAYVMFASHPPFGQAIRQSFWPERTDTSMIVALVGGTVGGYISFAGAHRLLDAQVKGIGMLGRVNRSAVTGILITGTMRYVLFLAALGVVWQGAQLGDKNPAASVFRLAAGELGNRFFGLVMWAAAITSVIGASFTSISFLKTFHSSWERRERWLITIFILISTLVALLLPQTPSYILVAAGILNGFILPVALAIMLLAVLSKRHFPGYRHPVFLQVVGWTVVLIMSWLSLQTIRELIP